jgi:pimeloyl-ACP methyl ester carboxylesterase
MHWTTRYPATYRAGARGRVKAIHALSLLPRFALHRPRRGGLFIAALLLGLLSGRPPEVRADARVRAAAVREETIRIERPLRGLRLALRHAATPETTARRPVVLILHGTNIAVSGNPDFPIGGRSLMTALAELGLDVWALDFYGYGESDRYPEMDQAADQHPPVGLAAECAVQVESVVDFLKQRRHVDQLEMIGDSRGSLVAGIFATRHPEALSRLVLFGPITPFTKGSPAAAKPPAYDLVTPSDLWDRLTSWSRAVGEPAALDATVYPAFAAAYLRGDPTSGTRVPPSVRVPGGPTAGMAAVASGQFSYDPSKIRARTLIVMGESDEITTFAGADGCSGRCDKHPSAAWS